MSGIPTPLTGSTRQVEWGNRIRLGMRDQGWPLPSVAEARFWIDNRDCAGPLELQEAARVFIAERDANFESPFTEVFPRYGREEAQAALEGLCRLARSVGVVVLDLETTGLEKADRVVEIAAVRWPSREVVIDTVIRPPDGRWPAISAIGLDEFAGAPPFDRVGSQIEEWVGAHHLVAWNVRFDLPVLRRELALTPAVAARLRATCAMRLTTAWLELDASLKLDEACELLSVDRTGFGQPHRAMADVLATCAVLDAMAKEVAGPAR